MQRSFPFIFCNAFFHFRYYSLYFARLVASLLQESLYKRQMIHIHVWSTGSTHVRTWCCEKIKTEIWQKKTKKSVNHCGIFQSSRLEWPHQITTCWGCEKATTPQCGSQVSTYEPWSNTDTHKKKKNNFDQIWVLYFVFCCCCFYKRLCLSITLRKSCVPLTFKQTNQTPASEVTMEGQWGDEKPF